jgi:PRC-barrel domain protein
VGSLGFGDASAVMLERVPGMNPGSYLTLRPGTDVVTADGQRIGSVKHVLVDEATNIFDGIVIDTGAGGLHFVDAPEVSEIREDAVLIAIPAAEVPALPRPRRNRGVSGDLERRLHRAWERVSGRR